MPLAFSALIAALDQIEGVPVIASVSSRAKRDRPTGGATISVIGAIRPASSARHEGVHEYLVGDPANRKGGHLRLTESSFRAATLTTLDGNDYFIVHVVLEGLDLVLQDENSGAP